MGFFNDIVSTVSNVVSDIAEPVMAVANPLTFFGSSVASGVLKGIAPELTSMASEVMGSLQPFSMALNGFANLGNDVRLGSGKNLPSALDSGASSTMPVSAATPVTMQSISTPYSGILDSIDQQQQGLTSQLNNPNLTPTQLLSLQDQIAKVNMMLQLISQIMYEDSRTKEAIIQHA